MFGFQRHAMFAKYNPSLGAFLPSAGWTGTAASGFGGGYGAVPTDPARTTAKPVCRLLVPPNQYFTDELVIGVFAAANNAGSLAVNLGLTKVVCHFEGMTRDITSPTVYTFLDANGVSRSYLGWWVTLKKPVATAGHANVYFEAIPANGAMQSRVIGPYQFSPQTALHDFTIEVAPTPAEVTGERYKTLDAALSYLRTQSAQNPLVTITEAVDFALNAPAFTYNGGNGYCTITATAAVNFKKSSTFDSANQLFRPRYDGLWFRGENITFDYLNVAYFNHESTANRAHVFEGVNFIDSGGRYATVQLGKKVTTHIARDAPWFMECSVSTLALPFTGASLVRGCVADGGSNDPFDSVLCCIGNTVYDWTSKEWREEIPALTVQYSGAGTGTLELSLANDVANRVFNAKVAGTSVGTFTVQISPAAFAANTNYTVQNVADWLNGLSGWTATVVDNTRRAASMSKTGVGSFGAIPATDVKTAPVTFITAFDDHTDLWKQFTTAENIICAGNKFYNIGGTGFLIQVTAGAKDVVIVNNAVNQDPADPSTASSRSQLQSSESHVVFAHNTLSNQTLLLRTDLTSTAKYNPDAYCLVANNAAEGITWESTADADLTIKGNHLHTGASTPTYATGTTIGGVDATLFTSSGTGDFTPLGALLTNLKTPVVAKDQAGAVRGATDAAGAIAS